jgi:hypothetical protein
MNSPSLATKEVAGENRAKPTLRGSRRSDYSRRRARRQRGGNRAEWLLHNDRTCPASRNDRERREP